MLLLSLVAVGVPQPLFASLDDFPPPVSGLHFLGELSDLLLLLMFRIDDEDVVEAAEATLDIASDMALCIRMIIYRSCLNFRYAYNNK